MTRLVLDPLIRDWALIPLTLIILGVYISRMLVLRLMQSTTAVDAEQLQQRNLVARSKRLRIRGGLIRPKGFAMRKEWLAGEDGVLLKEQESAVQDPMAMMGGMKNQVVFTASSVGLGYLINMLYSGHVLVQTPFGLTDRFRVMMQKGVQMPLLDPSWVTSFSWYLIVLYGVRPISAVLSGAGTSALDQEAAIMRQQMGMMGAGGGMAAMGFDPNKAFQAEVSALKTAPFVGHQLARSELSLLSQWHKGEVKPRLL